MKSLNNIKLNTYSLGDYLSNMLASLKLSENDQLWDLAKLLLKAIWVAVDVGLGQIPIANNIWALIKGFAVSVAVGGVVATLTFDLSSGLGQSLRDMFPNTSFFSTLDYEGGIAFVAGFVAFLGYFTAFQKTRAAKFLNGAVVSLAGIYGVDMFVDEVRKLVNKTEDNGGKIPKAMGKTVQIPLLRTFLSKFNFNFGIFEYLKIRLFSPKLKPMAFY